jgi:CHAT domain-containing protein
MIIPDGPLSTVPFELFIIDRKKTNTDKYLVSRFEVSYLNSISGLTSPGFNIPSAGSYCLCIGNPKIRMKPSVLGEGVMQSFYPGARLASNTLPESGAEVSELTQMLGQGQNPISLIGEEASEHAFKQLASKANVIHICTHSRIDNESPMLSSLVLAPDSLNGEDGDLTAYEVAGLDLHASLVVLNTCGTLMRTEGKCCDGIVRGFLEGGAQCIIGTNWDVDDHDARLFMVTFYQKLLTGKTVAESLRETKLFFIEDGTKDPFRWASYVLIGKPDVKLRFDTKPNVSQSGRNLVLISLLIFVVICWFSQWAYIRAVTIKRV